MSFKSSVAMDRAPVLLGAFKQGLKVVVQVVLLCSIWVAMDVARRHFGWSMPAGMIGFALLAVGLFTGLVKVQWLKGGTNWLLAEMLLFFVPAMLVVTEYGDLVRHQGLRILAVIIASTACVMVVTALAVDRVYRFELWLAHRRLCRSSHKE
ncbi:CidA/LrgA family protein [Diaphorobacter sp. HDW4B]|uniref:CidA/LrgA family protein n=1 Tax=Diaphorobacter sp. HDW4B TaxID=2714925 RepID=UPI00140C8D8B|nr:CidA/LrgA family protein [Diaphorobacter sp. HDW4B]QIL70754.1 CidA/LrgA family protein [Diaphorobacter sp. HDW4B]